MTRTKSRAAERPLRTSSGYAGIGDYAALGDGRTVALVARDGAIDWLPLPTIDQDSVFSAILDARRGGSFHLRPESEFTVERRYVDGTNVLVTTFTTAEGTLEVTDALTLQDGGLVPWVELARRARCTAGRVRLCWGVAPRFGFGREETTLAKINDTPVAVGKRMRLAVLAFDAGGAELDEEATEIHGAVELAEGDSALVVCIGVDNEPIPMPPREEIETRLESTCESWQRWSARQGYDGRWRDAVCRSALTLKLLTYSPTGAQTAAATSGLPERIGGSRNFDYRFCWIRDTTFALDVLARLGYRDQVHRTLSWLLDVSTPTHPRLQPLFGLDGQVPRTVEKLDLEGYQASEPVQLGNSAATQLQLGNYGDLFGTIARYLENGNALDPATAVRLAETADFVCEIWQHEDSGLWELGQHRHYTSSKMSCWGALTHAVEFARQGHLSDAHAERWQRTADEIHEWVDRECWSEEKRSYTFYAGTDELDCSVLRASQFDFVDPAGERMNGTIDALRRELQAEGPLLYRYSGMQDEEGCFLACSFWLVTALARAGRLDEAVSTMEELIALGNDVGLYSEEMAPGTLELLGNFPQALTHLALIQAAYSIADAEDDERGGNNR